VDSTPDSAAEFLPMDYSTPDSARTGMHHSQMSML
jgi:hypothetical protein